MINLMSIKYLRISQLEVDHHPNRPGQMDVLYCIFTLLDRTPYVDPTSEIEVMDAYLKLESGINSGAFRFATDDNLEIEAVPGSLENVKYFYAFNPNASVNQIDYFANTTIHVNRTFEHVIDEFHEKIQYSDGAQAGAVIGGMIAGILFGTLIVFAVIYMIRRQVSNTATGGLGFHNISFRPGNKRARDNDATITMQHLGHSTQESSS